MKFKRLSALAIAASIGLGGVALLPPAARAADEKPAVEEKKEPIALKAEVPADFVEKSLGEGGGTMKVPPDWKPQAAGANTKLSVAPPNVAMNVNVIVSAKDEGLTLAKLQPILPAAVGGSLKDFKLISNDILKLPSGQEAIRLVFDASVSGLNLRFSTFFAMGEKNQYVITYGALPDVYAKYTPTVEQMVASAKMP